VAVNLVAAIIFLIIFVVAYSATKWIMQNVAAPLLIAGAAAYYAYLVALSVLA